MHNSLRSTVIAATILVMGSDIHAQNAPRRHALYVYNCKYGTWTKARTSLDKDRLEATARIYNRTSNKRGKHYTVTNGNKPTTAPPCAKGSRTAAKNTTKLNVASTAHNFGKMTVKKNGMHQFVLTNPTGKPIRLTLTAISCGCTRVYSASEELHPRPVLRAKTRQQLPPSPIAEPAAANDKPVDFSSPLAEPTLLDDDEPVVKPAAPGKATLPSPAEVAGDLSRFLASEKQTEAPAAPIARPVKTSITIPAKRRVSIELTWKTGEFAGPFHQFAEFQTDGEDKPKLRLEVIGVVES